MSAYLEPFLFLLGGHDLEMAEIKNMLIQRGYVEGESLWDRKLAWHTASINAYEDLLSFEGTVFGIELAIPDGFEIPKNYHSIDHHNEAQDNPASIEQIAEILQIELTRDQQLIAANDKGYIKAMVEMGATDEEVQAIRLRDRQSQGSSEEDEKLGEESIARNKTQRNEVIVVKALTPRFATIRDRLPHDVSCIIYNEKEVNYYGRGKHNLPIFYEKEVRDGRAYHGGGPEGFFGISSPEPDWEATEQIVEFMLVIAREVQSDHVFLFPFEWKMESAPVDGASKLDWLETYLVDRGDWTALPYQVNDAETYNESRFFYDFVSEILYDKGEAGSNRRLFRHFEYRPVLDKPLYYEIKIKGREQPYRLWITSILLNMYDLGVGVLSFHLVNHDHPLPEEVLAINQYGRRIYPPFLSPGSDPLSGPRGAVLPEYIKIDGIEESKEEFNRYSNQRELMQGHSHLLVPNFIAVLFIPQLIAGTKVPSIPSGAPVPSYQMHWSVVTDGRMFVVCRYSLHEDLPICLKVNPGLDWSNPDSYCDAGREFWLQYLFVDSGGASSQNDTFSAELLSRATYLRWSGRGTLYGVSRYSMVCLTEFPPTVVHMKTIYYKIAELCLVQRAVTLRFSDEVTEYAHVEEQKELIQREAERLQQLYQHYLTFLNKIYFREIGAQEQGIELYQMLQSEMNISEQARELKEDIASLFTYLQLKKDAAQAYQLNTLTLIGGLWLVPGLILGFLGINGLSSPQMSLSPYWYYGLTGACLLFFVGGIGFFLKRNFWKMRRG